MNWKRRGKQHDVNWVQIIENHWMPPCVDDRWGDCGRRLALDSSLQSDRRTTWKPQNAGAHGAEEEAFADQRRQSAAVGCNRSGRPGPRSGWTAMDRRRSRCSGIEQLGIPTRTPASDGGFSRCMRRRCTSQIRQGLAGSETTDGRDPDNGDDVPAPLHCELAASAGDNPVCKCGTGTMSMTSPARRETTTSKSCASPGSAIPGW